MNEKLEEILKIREKVILKNDPNPTICSVKGCKRYIDATEGLGKDTSCPYHRLLYDYWTDGVVELDIFTYTQRGKRSAFTQWRNKHSKEELDEIVWEMAQCPINWKC